jgi:O-antigen/teichoic acid export membrane protein
MSPLSAAWSRERRFAGYAAVMVGQAIVQSAASAATSIVLARVLGVTGFATYGVVVTTGNLGFGIVRLGVEAAILVHTAECDAKNSTRAQGELLGAGLLLLVAAAAAGFGACLLFGESVAVHVFGDASLAKWIRVAGASTFLLCLSQFCYVALTGLQRFIVYSKVTMSMAVIQAVAISFASRLGLHAAVVTLVVSQAVTVALMAVALHRELRIDGIQLAFRNTWLWMSRLLGLGVPAYLAGLFLIPVTYYLQGMLTRRAGLETLGYLRAVVAVTTIVTFMPSSATTAIIVMLTGAKRIDAFVIDTMRSLKIATLFAVVAAAAVSVALPWLIPVMFGSTYRASTTAASVALVSSVCAVTWQVVFNALLAARRVFLALVASILQMGVFFVIGRMLIARYGLIGYVLADVFGYAVLLTVIYGYSLSWLRRNVADRERLSRLLVPFLLLLICTAVHLLQGGAPSRATAVTGFCAVVLMCMWGYHAILDKDERHAVNRLLRVRTIDAVLNVAATE